MKYQKQLLALREELDAELRSRLLTTDVDDHAGEASAAAPSSTIGIFDGPSWVDYKLLKKSLKAHEPDQAFFEKWERELDVLVEFVSRSAILAAVAHEVLTRDSCRRYASLVSPSNAVEDEEDVEGACEEGRAGGRAHVWKQSAARPTAAVASVEELCQRYLRANCEALRKAAKKFDKQRGKDLQGSKLLHVEAALRRAHELEGLRKGEVGAANADATGGGARRGGQRAGRDNLHPQNWFSRARTPGVQASIVLLVLVALQPFVVEWSKEREQITSCSNTTALSCSSKKVVAYSPVSVILLEAVCSVLVACAIQSYREKRSIGSAHRGVKDALYAGIRPCVHPGNVVKFLPTGFLRAVEDSLSIYALQYVSPTTYLVLLQLRLLLTGAFSVFIPECTAPNRIQWHALGFTLSGILAFKTVTSHAGADKNSTAPTSKDDELFGTAILAVAVVCKVAASLWAERALKRGANESIVVQTANISTGTVFASLLLFPLMESIFADKSKSADEQQNRNHGGEESSPSALTSPSAFFAGWTGITLFLVFYLLGKNWTSNMVVKKVSATAKYVVYALAIVCTYALEILFAISSFSLAAFVCSLCVVQGGVLFGDAKY
eukprot:g13502.t1